MNAKTTRILKEARPLFWPWCAVILAGLLPLTHPPHSIGWLSPVGFFLGIPLLAVISFGDEFQHRTLPLLLSQPISRMEIWGEKLSVMALAVLSAALVFSVSLRLAPFRPDSQNLVLAGACIIATMASATFWTLFARSTLGGVTLNGAVLLFIMMALNLAYWLRGSLFQSMTYAFIVPTGTFAVLCYAGVMLWLGQRKLARFQVTGGLAGDDLLTAGPDVMPGAIAGWLRCRPTGAVLNLIRKELRLLRPVWLISLLAALGWTCLTVFRLVHHQGSMRNFEIVAVSLGVIWTLMIVILAGSLSLGEERSSGTHAWHMTLPVSTLLQWHIKLTMALFAGFVGAGLLPALIAGGFLVGQSQILADVHFGISCLMVGVLILVFAAFWCACAVNGTLSAVLWVTPVTIALACASYLGIQGAAKLMDLLFSSRLNPFANFRIAWGVAHLAYRHLRLFNLLGTSRMYATLVGGPALLLALIQSYRMFRAQLRDSTRSVARNLLPIAMLVFLCGFPVTAFNFSLHRAEWQVWMLVGATSRAIQKTLPGAAKLDARHPLQLTWDDVVKDDVVKRFPFRLPESTRRWLLNAHITVTPDKAHPGAFYCTEAPSKSTWCGYSATIHLADGTDLIESFEPTSNRKFPFGRLSVHAHWPGTERQESLWDR